MVIPDSEIKPFLMDVPYIIHIPHEKFGVNIGDLAAKEYTMQKINESITWADRLNAKHLILHTGHGSMQHATTCCAGCQTPSSLRTCRRCFTLVMGH